MLKEMILIRNITFILICILIFISHANSQEIDVEHNIAFYKEIGPLCKADIKNGLEKKYDVDGRLLAEANCVNGENQGLYRNYYKNGNVREERFKKNKKYHGIAKTYYEDGTLRSESNYKNGKTIEYSRYYYPSGELKREGKFESVGNGVYYYYFKDGSLKDQCRFEDGQFISKCLGDSGPGIGLPAK